MDRRRVIAVRSMLVLIVAVLVGLGLWYAGRTSPTADSFYPKCMFYQATGLHCPGCGTGRSLHATLNGEFLTAFLLNPYSFVILPIVAIILVQEFLRWAFLRPPRQRTFIRGSWIWALAIGIIVFTVARNLPWYPFTLLAPQEVVAANPGEHIP